MRPRRLGRGLRDLGAPHLVPLDGGAAAPPRQNPVSADRAARAGDAAPRPVIICITSGKGGTGKSVITSNLAVHLAGEGKRVMLVDADLGLANLHLLLGVQPTRTILDVIERGVPLDEVAQSGPVGVRLAAGGSGLPEMADLHPGRLQRLVLAMEQVGDGADIILVDTGAGIGRATTSFLYALREIVVVTTPDVTAMTDGYAVIKNVVKNNRAARLSVVVNRATSALEGLQVFGRMDHVSRRFLGRPLRYLGYVLEDRRVTASVAARLPIVLNQPAAPAAACLRGVGRSLLLDVASRPGKTGAPDADRTQVAPPAAE